MKITGTLFQITDLVRFVTSFIKNHKPDPKSFKPFDSGAVFLNTDFPLGFNPPSFATNIFTSSSVDHNGNFSLSVPPNLPNTVKGFLNAARLVDVPSIPGVPKLPKLPSIIYRSAPFKLSAVTNHPQEIFVAHTPITNAQGISQQQIDQQVDAARHEFNQLDTLSAFITDSALHLVGTGLGNSLKIMFDINLFPATGSSLSDFIDFDLENVDIDLPGPDFITGLCISEDELTQRLHQAVGELVDQFNPVIKDLVIKAITDGTGVDPQTGGQFFDQKMSMTFETIRHPVVKTTDIGFQNLKVKIRALVPDPFIGMPRTLFS
ncbi:MAG TPA: hypothetical protein VKB46_03735 [Pyrinomonadaceae bacterium]|nr:hypothetical protein [Pyrinomonadaceae bacterium]